MVFGDFVIKLRKRLQDVRTLAGTSISAFAVDGARWTSDELIEIANFSFEEAIRLINSYTSSPLMRDLGQGYFVAEDGINITNGVADLPNTSLDVLSVKDDADKDYDKISPIQYREFLDSQIALGEGRYYFTVMQNVVTEKRQILVLPQNTVTLTYSYIFNKIDYDNTDGTTELHLQGLDGFLLDIAEREARDREHNWDRSKQLDARIAIALGVQMKG